MKKVEKTPETFSLPLEPLLRKGRLGTRVVSLLTGVLLTPYTMLTGCIGTVVDIAKIVGGGILYGGFFLGVELSSKKVSHEKSSAHRFAGEFFHDALFSVRVSMLKMVPIFGSQLANAYESTGNFKGAMKTIFDSSAFGGLLGAFFSLPQLAYSVKNARKLSIAIGADAKKSVLYTTNYLKMKKPKVLDAKEAIDFHSKGDVSHGMVLRVPVKTADGMTRYHDATLLLSEKNKGKGKGGSYDLSKVLVYYHGNAETRDAMDRSLIRSYRQQGYNVLTVSYSGDNLIGFDKEGNPKPVGTKCSELALREDAQADVAFIEELSRLSGKAECHVAVHGFSFGGALAGNFIEAVADSPASSMSVDFVVLDRTFTSVPDGAANMIRNITHSSLLLNAAKHLTHKAMMEEVGRAAEKGCDGLDTARKVAKVKDSLPFERTRFLCIGAREDEMMGERKPLDPHNPRNFAYDLAARAPEKAEVKMVAGGHLGSSQNAYRAVVAFLKKRLH